MFNGIDIEFPTRPQPLRPQPAKDFNSLFPYGHPLRIPVPVPVATAVIPVEPMVVKVEPNTVTDPIIIIDEPVSAKVEPNVVVSVPIIPQVTESIIDPVVEPIIPESEIKFYIPQDISRSALTPQQLTIIANTWQDITEKSFILPEPIDYQAYDEILKLQHSRFFKLKDIICKQLPPQITIIGSLNRQILPHNLFTLKLGKCIKIIPAYIGGNIIMCDFTTHISIKCNFIDNMEKHFIFKPHYDMNMQYLYQFINDCWQTYEKLPLKVVSKEKYLATFQEFQNLKVECSELKIERDAFQSFKQKYDVVVQEKLEKEKEIEILKKKNEKFENGLKRMFDLDEIDDNQALLKKIKGDQQ